VIDVASLSTPQLAALAASASAELSRRLLLEQPAIAPEALLDAPMLARALNVAESWVRTEERLGHIPSVRLGRYVRFRLSEVQAALTAKET
jgi:hypothetical protein